MFLAEVVGEKRNSGIQQVARFDGPALDNLVKLSAPGKGFKHWHEVGGMGRLCAQLYLGGLSALFLLLFLFHK